MKNFIFTAIAAVVFSQSFAQATRAAYFTMYNSATGSFPINAAAVKSGVVSSASVNYSGLSTYNDSRCVWTNTNATTTLNTATAPYLSYSLNFVSGNISFDRFVMAGLAEFGATKLQLRWSVDSYASSLGEFTINGSSYTLSSVSLSAKGIIPVSGVLTFRVYFYNGGSQVFNSDTGPYASLDGTPASYGAYGQNVAVWYTAFSTLPFQLLDFTAEQENGQVLLNWETAREVDTKDFVVQRSSDGLQWNNIGVVQAAVNSSQTLQYHFVDTNPIEGSNQYRLLQRDVNGAAVLSAVKLIQFKSKLFGMRINGNPVTNQSLQLEIPNSGLVTIVDVHGTLRYKKQLTAGKHLIALPNYSKGLYIIKMGSATQKMIVQ